MNLKLSINKSLERGMVGKLFWFSVINTTFFIVLLFIYLRLNDTVKLSIWDVLLLFMDSDVMSSTEAWARGSIVLVIIECLGSILFSGLIISLLTSVIIEKVGDIKDGHVHYKLKNHVVLIGYDSIVPSLIEEIVSNPQYKGCHVVLQTSENMEDIRCTLHSKLSKKELRKVVLVHAPRLSLEELQHLNTADARSIFVVGDRTQHDHDAGNMQTFEALVTIHQQLGVGTKKPLTIWFENEASFAALQLNDISAEWKKYFDFRPYNFYKRWANRLLAISNYTEYSKQIVYPELDHKGIGADSTKHIHLIIVGMNRMGLALAKEAAHLLHFPNFDDVTGANRTRITFIDDNADVEKDFLMGRLPGYFSIAPTLYTDLTGGENENTYRSHNFLDIQFEFVKGRVESPQVREWLRNQLKDEDALISIAICIENPSQSFGMAMYLPEEVYTRGRNNASKPWEVEDESKIVNIFVRQETIGSLIKSFSDSAKDASAQNKRYANIYPFGMQDESFALNNRANHLAMAFNYIYDYYFSHDKTLPYRLPSFEELSVKWQAIPTSHQWSNHYLADSIEFKLRSIGLDKDTAKDAIISKQQLEALSYAEHNRWDMEKLLLGYRALTEEEEQLNSQERKILKNKLFAHHLIMPYAQLSEGDKDLDRNIIKALPDILRMLDV